MTDENTKCYRCQADDVPLVTVELNTGPGKACMTCYKEGRRFGVFGP